MNALSSSMPHVCVFCGANTGNSPEFGEVADALGRALARRGMGLVYGGTSVGLMGRIADAVLEEGGRAVGVLPAKLQQKEIAHRGLSELHLVETLNERKTLMFGLSDAFIAMPGGLGTLDELGEMLTWAQLGYHEKPMGLLNISGYFDGLLAFFERGKEEGLIRPKHLEALHVSENPNELLHRLLPHPEHPAEVRPSST